MILYNGNQIDNIAESLRLNKRVVNLVLFNYRTYLEEKINSGETVKVLNICYIRNYENTKDYEHETLAYIASNIARGTDMGSVTVLRILTTLEEMIVRDIAHGERYALKGLIRIRTVVTEDGVRVRVAKSSKYNNKPVKVVVLGSFKRKVEEMNARKDA